MPAFIKRLQLDAHGPGHRRGRLRDRLAARSTSSSGPATTLLRRLRRRQPGHRLGQADRLHAGNRTPDRAGLGDAPTPATPPLTVNSAARVERSGRRPDHLRLGLRGRHRALAPANPSHTYTTAGELRRAADASPTARRQRHRDRARLRRQHAADRDDPGARDGSSSRSASTVELRGSATDPQDGDAARHVALTGRSTLIHNTHIARRSPVSPGIRQLPGRDRPRRRRPLPDHAHRDRLSGRDAPEDGRHLPATVNLTFELARRGAVTYGGTTDERALHANRPRSASSSSISAAPSSRPAARPTSSPAGPTAARARHNITIPSTDTTLTATYRRRSGSRARR